MNERKALFEFLCLDYQHVWVTRRGRTVCQRCGKEFGR